MSPDEQWERRATSRAMQAVPAGIAAQMVAEGGLVSFARFMELALTHPTDGYYSRADRILGPRGDFSTAPRLSQVFNLAACRLVEELVDGLAGEAAQAVTGDRPRAPRGAGGPSDGGDRVAIVELGPGEGDLAQALLSEWDARRPDLRYVVDYRLVEVGERLRARQRRALTRLMRSGWPVEWSGDAQEALRQARAVIVMSNEFFDVLPLHLVDVSGAEALEAWVEVEEPTGGSVGEAAAREIWGPLSPEARTELSDLFQTADPAELRAFTRDGFIEVRPAAGAVVREFAVAGQPICLLTVDYGEWFAGAAPAGGRAPRAGAEAPHVPLRGRTLRGYFRHQLVSDPYARVGRQDLTADVDFAAIDLHGRQVGFETVLFTTVAALLRASGAEDRLRRLVTTAGKASSTALTGDREATVLEALLDGEGIGGVFKVMLQVKE